MSARSLILARADQVSRSAGDVPSPCLSVCRMEAASALCAGCFRTLQEIAAWGQMPEAGKRAVWQEIAVRAGRAPRRPEPT